MILGIDTSAYTTSVAIINSSNKEPLLDVRNVLEVPRGMRGLRQSEAVFQHIRNMENISPMLKSYKIKAISVSSKPRPFCSSYMPVFKVSQTIGKLIAAALDIPLFQFSHQEGHIAAGLWSTNSLLVNEKILVLHISGGTSDVLEIVSNDTHFNIKDLGCSTDLHAGQYIDRVGVALGSGFPAGKQMDIWANQIENISIRIASSVDNYNMSFSGPESAAHRLIAEGMPKEEISKAVFISIARTLEKIIRYAYKHTNYHSVLLVGGVACNSILRNELTYRLPFNIKFCSKKYSSDNAVGVALLGEKMFFNRRKKNDKIN